MNMSTRNIDQSETSQSRIGRQRMHQRSHRRWCTVLALFALTISTTTTVAFQPSTTAPSRRTSTTRTSTSRVAPIVSTATKRSSPQHYFALDYRDLSSSLNRKSRSRLSLSSIAAPSPTTLVNDGSEYYSWLTSGWNKNAEEETNNGNIYVPSKTATATQQPASILSHSEEYQRRKEEWAKRYTSLNGLRKAFGSNKNKLWGDLDAKTTRKLYKSLLPNALCELVLELGVEPEELAPLAYKARKAAKLYARERCQVPARLAANLFDGFRQWRRYGRFQPAGMSYEQLWEKYYHEQLQEHCSIDDDCVDEEYMGDLEASMAAAVSRSLELDDSVTEEEIVTQTCQKILEKSCTTNEMVDHMVLGNNDPDRDHHNVRKHRNELLLKRISRTLERDVRKLLDPALLSDGNNSDEARERPKRTRPLTPQEYHALKLFALSRRQAREAEAQVVTAAH